MASLTLKVEKCPTEDLAVTNCVIACENSPLKGSKYVKIRVHDEDFFFTLICNDQMKTVDGLGFSNPQRKWARLALKDPLQVRPHKFTGTESYLGSMVVEIDFLKKTVSSKDRYDSVQMAAQFLEAYRNNVFMINQEFAFGFTTADKVMVNFLCSVKGMTGLDALLQKGAQAHGTVGVVVDQTKIVFRVVENSNVALVGAATGGDQRKSLFDPEWRFEEMGIGGLDAQFRTMFRRAFVSRIMPPEVVEKLGMQHVKGILLYGPPGTGKTLMARQIGSMLNGRPPKVVNGPEVLNKFVGESEANIRKLFEDAELEYKQRGDNSSLHIIIFDEIDAICKTRGSTSGGTGVQDSVVNQLLSKIDGVDALNNILLIGMTNRMDMIDEALLRPGRLELKLQIGLPDVAGRLQIFKIHTKRMKDNGMMAPDVNLEILAERSKNFSGAEIAGLVRAAVSFSSESCIKHTEGVRVDEAAARSLKVRMEDFERALSEVIPAFGVDSEQFEGCMLNGIVQWDACIQEIQHNGQLLAQQVELSKRTPLVTLLLEGEPGTGKTALATDLAIKSGFPLIKMVSPEKLVGYTESHKVANITKTFEDAYKSVKSCIVVDDIERLIEWVPIGARFSNLILQALMVLLKKQPPNGHKLLVIVTTSSYDVFRQMRVTDTFSKIMHISNIEKSEQVLTVLKSMGDNFDAAILKEIQKGLQGSKIVTESGTARLSIAVKKLFMIAEMSRQSDDPAATFLSTLLEECQQRFPVVDEM